MGVGLGVEVGVGMGVADGVGVGVAIGVGVGMGVGVGCMATVLIVIRNVPRQTSLPAPANPLLGYAYIV